MTASQRRFALPGQGDRQAFLDLAGAAGWRVPSRELDLYGDTLHGSAYVLWVGERRCGFVSAVLHERSGWIGNLIVPEAERGRGHGKALLEFALSSLRRRGACSAWLTASDLGRPIYERYGFRRLDAVLRWTAAGRGGVPAAVTPAGALFAADARAWGESRRALLQGLLPGGRVLGAGNTVALLQAPAPMQVLGPWYSEDGDADAARALLAAALASAERGGEVVTDVIESSPLNEHLGAAGFRCLGGQDLMVLGPADGGNLRSVVALASLGSMG